MDKYGGLKVGMILVLGVLNLNFAWSHYEWEKIGSGIAEPEVTCVAFAPEGGPKGRPQGMFVGTTKSAYRVLSPYKGSVAQALLQASGASRRVNYLYASPVRDSVIYAATDSGLFLSTNDGGAWKRILFSNDSRERRCLWVIEDENTVYLATAGGLFYKTIDGPVWSRAQGDLNSKAVAFLAEDGTYIYAATENKIFRIDPKSQEILEIFSVMGGELNGNGAETQETEGEDASIYKKQILSLVATNKRKSELYVATTKGIFYSSNQGKFWEEIDVDGLPLESATSLTVLREGEIVLGTQKGVFIETEDGWEHIYGGMETSKVNFLACDEENHLYAATDKGIFLMKPKKTLPDGVAAMTSPANAYWADEPSIREVHRMAIAYAEVGADKIRNWRRLAQARALMPEVSLDFDKTVTTALGSTYDRTAIGPQDWGVNLKWDIAELVWSSEQTSIDSRSKLMVELREDILDQVTRLYFERRRLQADLVRDLSLGTQEREDKEMRVEELTALIDGFTGGEFSRRIEVCRQSPVASDQ
ncbi:MAG TPA: hypothetical protein PL155_09260 [Candidatus Omnitrophota bacterium]|nr:hypothetical protein [Candidatus Omnitrophota bacterium]HPD85637.1 hypothetical protein [Candidatus Omnitrophota bacterium]HRZ04480.1 hypothetical protein [Candidatus Omnitrophota bacterium]